MYNKLKESLRSVNDQLRTKFDGDDPVRLAFRIGGLRRSGGKRSQRREAPTWALNDKAIRKILLRSFPKLSSDDKQHRAAARWAHVIYLFWHLKLTIGQIALELNVNIDTVRALIRSIKRVAKGQRADGSGILGHKRGRPRKSMPILRPLIESNKDQPGTRGPDVS